MAEVSFHKEIESLRLAILIALPILATWLPSHM